MKDKTLELLELFNDWWVVYWFVIGMIFIVLATIAICNKENDKALACVGICLACHARCEVKILQRKMTELVDLNDDLSEE